jgi:hypothetical protein
VSDVSDQNGRHDPLERALEVFVYAPLGIGLWVRDLTPSLIDTVVARGRAEVDRRQEQAQQHITTARSMGQVALAFGMPKLRKRAERQLRQVRAQADRVVEQVTPSRNGAEVPASPSTARPPAEKPAAPATAVKPKAAAEAVATAAPPQDAAAAGRSASSAHLPIPGYDALSASQVVERLAGLGPDELSEVRAYEAANRHRRTILGKIDQLTA